MCCWTLFNVLSMSVHSDLNPISFGLGTIQKQTFSDHTTSGPHWIAVCCFHLFFVPKSILPTAKTRLVCRIVWSDFCPQSGRETDRQIDGQTDRKVKERSSRLTFVLFSTTSGTHYSFNHHVFHKLPFNSIYCSFWQVTPCFVLCGHRVTSPHLTLLCFLSVLFGGKSDTNVTNSWLTKLPTKRTFIRALCDADYRWNLT